ncbi:lipoprotein localization protein LolB [[Haemophilus] felis]|uniref:Outer-membrane lipoprotein LolB n=1 Tax=[Haemophilus] felis TaxID=123822 RepID=A0A1T0AY60_9PAST|nr:lipoprotein localization protein LolB [[Haemophilus] felis]NBI40969.1 lipoprotein localization protein LolB [[Haemophilus] felis]OOS02609.1 lipoprotein localization factor LolB [[Haemophilus] felis]
MNTYLSRIFPFVISLLISACSLNIEAPTEQTYLSTSDAIWQQHLQKVKQLKSYEVKGQIGYIAKDKRFSSRFHWHYTDANNYSLTLYSNISTQALVLSKQQNQLQISDQNDKQYSQEEIDNLLRTTVGTQFPLEQFGLWLKGQPDENRDYKVGENHLLAHFAYPLKNTIWTADYINFHQMPLPLPKDILLKSHTQTLKIRSEEWKY